MNFVGIIPTNYFGLGNEFVKWSRADKSRGMLAADFSQSCLNGKGWERQSNRGVAIPGLDTKALSILFVLFDVVPQSSHERWEKIYVRPSVLEH